MFLFFDFQRVDVDDGGIDIFYVYDFGFFVTVFMKNGISINENEDVNFYCERVKYFYFIRM